MADGYSWNYARSESINRLPGPEHLGWWAALAIVLSLVLHVVVFFALERLEVVLNFHQARELSTGNVNVTRVEVRPQEEPARMDPEEVVTPPNDAADLLDEVDLLAALPENPEIDISPEVEQAAYALRNPAKQGDPLKMDMEAPGALELDAEMPEIAAEPQTLKPAEIGQVAVDPRSRMEDEALDNFTDNLLGEGGGGLVDGRALEGVESLDSLLNLPPNLLLSKKTMLPSDLLFEYNRSELRESAKIGLMKLALLMDRNPDLFCWIEGHTDMIGGDAFNRELSLARAEAVKSHLVDSLRMDAEKIITRGFGKSQPLVTVGDANVQAPNRRVEIRMRKTPPKAGAGPDVPVAEPVESAEPVLVVPPRAVLVVPPRAVLVPPGSELPVDEVIPRAVPRAELVVPEGE